MKRIGVLGGTFDPVHRGHLFAARYARRMLPLDEVLFVPCYAPPHRGGKKPAHSSPWDRYAMTALAVSASPGLGVSPVELEAGRKMYALETLRELQKKNRRARLVFLMGEDSLYDLPTWWKARQLVEQFDFAVFQRHVRRKRPLPAYVERRLRVWKKSRQSRDPSSGGKASLPAERRVYLLSNRVVPLSSTGVRRALRRDPRDGCGVPSLALSFLRKRGLYRA
jgi:nicotinate-nucleotide adenylyltransferase